ncbi:hypothetical protein ACF0H5_016691 [Mactra antiquata]
MAEPALPARFLMDYKCFILNSSPLLAAIDKFNLYLSGKLKKGADAKWIHCDECYKYFKEQECFTLHKKPTVNGNSTCTLWYNQQMFRM